jgi:hypothetical protein
VSPFVARRTGFIVALLGVSALTAALSHLLEISLHPAAIYTGGLLLALVLALTLFNARKKLPFLPLGNAATWLQIHIYVGLFSLVVFLLHIHFRAPHGWLQGALAFVFCLVAFSGVFGLYISRSLPPRMTRSGEPLIYERIPAYRLKVKSAIEDLVRKAEAETDSSTLGNYYVAHLREFVDHVPAAPSALLNPERALHGILAGMTALNRYLNPQEKEIAGEIGDWIETKQNLDFQYASQRLLKLWLFIHIPATYALILLALVHGYTATIYAGRL